MISLNSITIDKSRLEINSLLENLKEFGIVVIPNYINSNELMVLKNEFEKLILDRNENYSKSLQYSVGLGNIILLDKLDIKSFPQTKAVFSSHFMREISEAYLESKVNLNSEIFLVKDVVGSKHHANDLHFDITPTFKFFIYLTDTNQENGAFSCVPGSHKKAELLRKELGSKISYENRELSRQLPVSEEEVISIDGIAGTLIIFDTDVFHRAGTVYSGERKVMRGHTRKSNELILNKNKSVFSKIKSILKGK